MRSLGLGLLVCFACLFCGAVAAHEDDAPRGLFPEIVPWPYGLHDYYFQNHEGRRLLRFSAGLTNIGYGRFEVFGVLKHGRMVAFQKIYCVDGHSYRRRIGEFLWHEQHQHWHLLKMAEYRLLDGDGNEVTASGKVSFCLADETRDFPALPGSPPHGYFLGCSQDPLATRLRAGISIGWSDIYEATRYGQWVDVTDVPPGDYILECHVDPDGIIQEPDPSNNTLHFPVHID